MQLNKKVEYAISTVLYVYHMTRTGDSVTANQIHDATDIPQKYLTIILSELQRYGILKSVRGFKGGYYINKQLKEINLNDIIQATSRPSTKRNNNTDNLYQNFARMINEEISNEYQNILQKTDFEIIFKKFENSVSPMTPMFYI